MNYNAKVISIREVTPEIKLFRVKPDGWDFAYKAGQFAVLGLPRSSSDLDGEWIRRAYSITSAPSEEFIEFYIVLVSDGREVAPCSAEDGRLTSRLFALREGDGIYLAEKSAGLMTFSHAGADKDILFLSTGTGIAPFVSMLREHSAELFNGRRKVGLVHGVRHSDDLAYRDWLENLAAEQADFYYYPVVSRDESFGGLKGRADAAIPCVERDFGTAINPDMFEIFICGNPKMVDDMVERWISLGFVRNTLQTSGNLYFDKH